MAMEITKLLAGVALFSLFIIEFTMFTTTMGAPYGHVPMMDPNDTSNSTYIQVMEITGKLNNTIAGGTISYNVLGTAFTGLLTLGDIILNDMPSLFSTILFSTGKLLGFDDNVALIINAALIVILIGAVLRILMGPYTAAGNI